MRLTLAFLFCSILPAAVTEPTAFLLSLGVNTFTANDTGGGVVSQLYTLPSLAATPTTRRYKVWLDQTAAYPQHGSGASCNDPCTILIDMTLGKVAVNYELVDAAGSSLTPPVTSTLQNFLSIPTPTHLTAPFTYPLSVHGFKDYTEWLDFSIPGGTDVSQLAWYGITQNVKAGGNAAVVSNAGTEHVITTVPIVGWTSNGTVCSFTTLFPHGFLTSDTIQHNFMYEPGNVNFASQQAIQDLQVILQTVASTPTATTYTVACSVTTGTYNTAGLNVGRTVSKSFRYCGEDRWFRGLDNELLFNCIMIPFGATEFTAGATNTIGLRFKGAPASFIQVYGLQHGPRWLESNLLQLNRSCNITQIVVTSLNAVATCDAPHGYADGDTVVILRAPSYKWRFEGRNTITAHTSTTFTFLWGANIDGGGVAGSGIYTTPNGTYTVPTSNNTAYQSQPTAVAYRALIPATSFAAYDPAGEPTYGGNAATGATLAATGALKDPNPYAGSANASVASCASCHVNRNGFNDLAFFGYESKVIRTAAMHRGMTQAQASDIVAWVVAARTGLSTPTALSRPWNPPFQPGPGLDALTIREWIAGAGYKWVPNYDPDMKEKMCPSGSCNGDSTWAYNGTINNRELPLYLQLATWNKWLAEVYPGDMCVSFGCTFSSLTLSSNYETALTNLVPPKQLSGGVNASDTAWTLSAALACTTNDVLQADPGTATMEYITVTAGCGTTSLTISRNTTVQGISHGASNHSSGAYISDYSAYSRAITPGSSFLGSWYANAFPGPGSNLLDVPYLDNLFQPFAGGGFINPSMYARSGFAAVTWMMSRYFELLTAYQLWDMNDTTVRANQGISSLSANSGAQFTRGATIPIGFAMGLHLNKWLWNYWGLNTYNASTTSLWDHQTAVWYGLANVIQIDSRLSHSGGTIDWQYTLDFNNRLSNKRPAWFMHMLWDPIQIQNTMGKATMVSAACCSSFNNVQFSRNNQVTSQTLFVSQSEVGDYSKGMASRWAAISALYNTAAWQTYITTVTSNASYLTLPVDISTPGTEGGGGNIQSQIARGVVIMAYYINNAMDASLLTLKAWFNAVWAASGYDLQTAIDLGVSGTCTISGTPAYLTCPGF